MIGRLRPHLAGTELAAARFPVLRAELFSQEELPFVSAAVVENIRGHLSTCIQKNLSFWAEQLQHRGVPVLQHRAWVPCCLFLQFLRGFQGKAFVLTFTTSSPPRYTNENKSRVWMHLLVRLGQKYCCCSFHSKRQWTFWCLRIRIFGSSSLMYENTALWCSLVRAATNQDSQYQTTQPYFLLVLQEVF